MVGVGSVCFTFEGQRHMLFSVPEHLELIERLQTFSTKVVSQFDLTYFLKEP